MEIWTLKVIPVRAHKAFYRESFYGLRENTYHHEQNVGRSMDVPGFGELSEMRNMLLESGGKVILVIYNVAKNLAGLCSSVVKSRTRE